MRDATWQTCSCRIASGLPWFTFSAIEFLETWIKPQYGVFEYGCGGSTLFFAERAKSVASVEHNGKWARSVTAAALKRGLTNVAIEVREAGREPPLADSPYCLALDRSFDVVVVDGWALGKCNEADRRAVQSRGACFQRAEQFVRPGGVIVLDDAWFDPGLEHHARDRRVFSGHWSLADRRKPNGCVGGVGASLSKNFHATVTAETLRRRDPAQSGR
jgi:SAM-dependent methyltransferase